MDFLKKNRIVFWVLVFLVFVNIAALAAHFISLQKPADEPLSASEGRKGVAIGRELSLSPEQLNKVNEINAAYRFSSEPIITALRDKKAALLEELSKDASDSLRIAVLAEEVSREQNKLQQANIRQFLDLKKVCTPEQTKKLSGIYAGFYGCAGAGRGQGCGNGNGKGYRHRHGWKQQDTISNGE